MAIITYGKGYLEIYHDGKNEEFNTPQEQYLAIKKLIEGGERVDKQTFIAFMAIKETGRFEVQISEILLEFGDEFKKWEIKEVIKNETTYTLFKKYASHYGITTRLAYKMVHSGVELSDDELDSFAPFIENIEEYFIEIYKKYGKEVKMFVNNEGYLELYQIENLEKLNLIENYKHWVSILGNPVFAYDVAVRENIYNQFGLCHDDIAIYGIEGVIDTMITPNFITDYDNDVEDKIKTFVQFHGFSPKPEAAQMFDQEEIINFDKKAWAYAVREYGICQLSKFMSLIGMNIINKIDKKRLFRYAFAYLTQSENIEEIIKEEGFNIPQNIYVDVDVVKAVLSYDNTEKGNKALKEVYIKQQSKKFRDITGTDLKTVNPSCNVNITLHEGKYTIRRLEKTSNLNLYLGEATHCCQHLDGAGAFCVLSGIVDTNACIVVFEKDNRVVAQAWTWLADVDGQEVLVLDNIETANGQPFEAMIDDFRLWLQKQNYKTVLLGLGYSDYTPSNCQRFDGDITEHTAIIKQLYGYYMYSDAHTAVYIKKDGRVLI